MSFFEDASLVLLPSAYKPSKIYSVKPTDGTGDLTFTRSNDTATRVGPDGLIEKVRTNLALRSQSFATSAVWSIVSGTITDNAGTAPDGTSTASKIVAGNTDPYVYQSLTLSGSVAVSCYVKGIGSSIGKVARILVGASFTDVTMDGTWQRISVVHTASGSEAYGLEIPNPALSGDEVLMWGFQVEYGDIATDYIATTTAAVSVGPVANVPRLDYLNSSCPRLLLEPQRTNIITYSEQFNNAAWSKLNATISANAATSPDGYTNADKLIPSNGASLSSISNYALQSITKAASAIQYTYSTFVKQDELNRVSIIAQGASILNNASATFSLVNGSIATAAAAAGTFTGASASVTDYGNGWYRCALVFTTNTDTDLIIRNIPTDSTLTTGNGTDGILIYGCQLELGAYATSYIPTLGAAVTTGADAASKTGISSLIGQTEGTLFAEFTVGGADGRVMSTLGGSNRFGMTAAPTNVGFFIVTAAGGVVYSNVAAFAHGTRTKMALAYKSGETVLYVNGSAILTTTVTYAFNAAITDLYLSQQEFAPGAGQSGQRQAQALLFKTRLTNAQLAELTA